MEEEKNVLDIEYVNNQYAQLVEHIHLLWIGFTKLYNPENSRLIKDHVHGYDLIVMNTPFGHIAGTVDAKFRSLYETELEETTLDEHPCELIGGKELSRRLQEFIR